MLLAVFAGPTLAEEWEPVLVREDLEIHRRPFEGSTLYEVRGVARFEASLNAVMALLRDAPYNRHWVYRSGGARILRENGHARAWVYGVVDAPWPMQDRDAVVRFDYRQDPRSGLIRIAITNVPDLVPREQGLVRVPEFGGFWEVKPETGGWVSVTYQVHGDPGGWVPVWAANLAAVSSVTRTLENMPTAALRYRDARSEHVREPGQPAP